jgi:hypothetical protein
MALPFTRGCPVYAFKPFISFGNDLLLPAALYGIKVPPGLSPSSVPAPDFISPSAMVSLLRQAPGGGHGRGLGVTHGLTTADFAIRFPNFAQQWRQVRTAATVPFWQFQGGDVYLDVTITVYVLEGDRPQVDDDLTLELFAIIMGHELLHVLDEIDIVKNWMAPQAYRDDKVLKYLSNAEPVDNAMFQSWFRGDGFSNWLKDGLWAPEHNRRGGLRDAPQQYAALQRQIDDVRIRMTNRPSR